MIKYYRYLKDFKFYPNPNEIIYQKNLDELKLKVAIDEFQKELDWDEMWNVDDAQQRLNDGWCWTTLEIDNKLKGWFWLDYETKEGKNLYVHKDYRDKGYGLKLINSIITAGRLRNFEYIWSQVDEWNNKSKRLFERSGYVIE
tara:strand:- start:5331 stop:5759 length:429 start_codon:yes stop_codon:yes gene_type:complete